MLYEVKKDITGAEGRKYRNLIVKNILFFTTIMSGQL